MNYYLVVKKKYVILHPRDPDTLPIRTVQHAGPFFLYTGMNYTKQALPLVAQIETLQQRGLVINDIADAGKIFSENNNYLTLF